MRTQLSVFTVFLTLLFSSCMSNVDNPYVPKNSALGVLNEIVVVSDEHLWTGIVGDSIDYYLAGAYPITPRPEPLFDLRHFTAEKINQERLLRELRTYLIVADISDEDSPTTQMVKKDIGTEKFRRAQTDPDFHSSVGKNKWASGQLLIYLFGKSHDEVSELIKANFENIAKRVHAHDRVQLNSMAFARGENGGLSTKIEEEFGINIKIPATYVVTKEVPEENFLWLINDDNRGSMSIIFKQMDYTDKSQLSKENLKALRDRYGKKYVSSPEPNSYMLTNDEDLPILEYAAEIGGQYGKEFRGIWELENDFIGGPFISYLFLSKDQKTLNFIDTWVFAPGKNKRDMLQQLELIVRGIE